MTAASTILFTLLTFLLIHAPQVSKAAFTEPTSNGQDSIQQNGEGTWCFYPRANFKTDVACTGNDAQFEPVMEVHLSQGVSISYYAPSLERLGGAEYPVKTTQGHVFLCISGRALDGKYVTHCEITWSDNRFGKASAMCGLEIAQEEVTDGCYEPGLKPTVKTAGPGGGTGGDGTGAPNSGLRSGGMSEFVAWIGGICFGVMLYL